MSSDINEDNRIENESIQSVQYSGDNKELLILSDLITTESTASSDNSRGEFCVNRTFSWHEHVYRKLSNKPTPHYIENILDINKIRSGKSSQCLDDLHIVKTNSVRNNLIAVSDGDSSTQNSFNKMQSAVTELIEPLNLSIRTDFKVRTKTAKGL